MKVNEDISNYYNRNCKLNYYSTVEPSPSLASLPFPVLSRPLFHDSPSLPNRSKLLQNISCHAKQDYAIAMPCLTSLILPEYKLRYIVFLFSHLVILSCPILHPADHAPSPYLLLLYFNHLIDPIGVMVLLWFSWFLCGLLFNLRQLFPTPQSYCFCLFS